MAPTQCEQQTNFTAGVELWGGRGWKGPQGAFLDFTLKSRKIDQKKDMPAKGSS